MTIVPAEFAAATGAGDGVTGAATTGAAAGSNLKATYKYGTEGLEVYVPGSGILFQNGIIGTLTQGSGTDGSVTLTITGA